MAPRATLTSLALATLAAGLASAQPAPGLAPLSPQIPSIVIPDLPPNAPRALVRAVEQARADPSSLPPYAPALIKSATTPVQMKTKEEHKAGWEQAKADWAKEHPNGYKGEEFKHRRLLGKKGGDGGEAGGEAVVVMKAPKAHKVKGDGEASKHHAKATKVYTVGEAEAGGKHHKGRLLLGGHGGGVDGEAGEAMKVHKVKKVHDGGEAAPKVHKKKVVYVDEAGEAGGHKKKHG